MTIQRLGYRARFRSARYTYLDHVIDGVLHQLWVMGNPLTPDATINRAVKKTQEIA